MNELPDVLTLEQAAKMLQVSPRTIQRMVAGGRMPGRQVGSQWRFHRDQLLDWVRGSEEAGSGEEMQGSAEMRGHDLSQLELIAREQRRLGVDLPQTLIDLQQAIVKLHAERTQSGDDEGESPDAE
jgi:excisionase family DNA binding protein